MSIAAACCAVLLTHSVMSLLVQRQVHLQRHRGKAGVAAHSASSTGSAMHTILPMLLSQCMAHFAWLTLTLHVADAELHYPAESPKGGCLVIDRGHLQVAAL